MYGKHVFQQKKSVFDAVFAVFFAYLKSKYMHVAQFSANVQ